ncbi:hypothetical protein DFH06DRAFT_1126067 [Mycena polygramma]|nr:hypothetical protein DFH06DRAFT_1126067 [Mycena polygramma]
MRRLRRVIFATGIFIGILGRRESELDNGGSGQTGEDRGDYIESVAGQGRIFGAASMDFGVWSRRSKLSNGSNFRCATVGRLILRIRLARSVVVHPQFRRPHSAHVGCDQHGVGDQPRYDVHVLRWRENEDLGALVGPKE